MNDVGDLGALLQGSTFGFSIPEKLQLTNQQASRAAIVSLVEDTLHTYLKPEDDLVVMYSGHGTRRDDEVGDQMTPGLLVPWDAHRPGEGERWSDYVDVAYLLNAIATLPPRHILVILDSCNSGLAVTGSFEVSRARPATDEKDLTEKIGRKVIASTQADENAADTSGKYPGHSLFAGSLIDTLASGKADSLSRGFVAGSRLGDYVSGDVGRTLGSKQMPLSGEFHGDGGGDVLFHCKVNIPAIYLEAYKDIHQGLLGDFNDRTQQLISAKPDAPQTLWARYRLDIGVGKIADAKEAVKSLNDMDEGLTSGLPIGEELGKLGNRLDAMAHFMQYPPGNVPLSIEVVADSGAGLQKVDGEPEIGSTFYMIPVKTPHQIIVTNKAASAIKLDCLAIDPSGVFSSTDQCGIEIGPGQKQVIPEEPLSKPVVEEFHFYAGPASSGAMERLSSQPPSSSGMQTMIRISYTKPSGP